jgi:peptide subunit release factor 1 (eRF1)
MAVPSLSIGVHDRYSPEVRDRIVDRLRTAITQHGGATYWLLTPAHLRLLAAVAPAPTPVLSLYLQLTPERRLGGAWRSTFSSLATSMLHGIIDRRERKLAQAELDRVERAMQEALPTLGRGVAFFAGRAIGLWHQVAVSVPLPDGVHWTARPYIRPLARTRDEHNRFVLAILSQEQSRFFISQIGQVEEVFRVKGEDTRGILADRAARDRRDVIISEALKNEARVLAHAVELVLAESEGRYLLVASGAPELRTAVLEHLPKAVHTQVGADFTSDVHAGAADVAAAAEPAQRAVEEREEVATIGRIRDAGPHAAAWGAQPTLDALRLGRVMTLAVDEEFAKPGARCGTCTGLWATVPPRCPACGSAAIEQVEDVVELAIEAALEQRATLEVVRSVAARQLMRETGPMAALLRW